MIPMIAITQQAANTFGTLYVVACLLAALLGLMFAILWFVFPLIVWTKMNEQIKLLTKMVNNN
jgi:uncharacterized Tic20 family protein